LTLVVLGLGGWVDPYVASAEDGKIKGLAAGVPGGSISLLTSGNPSADFQVGFGDPAILFPVVISPTTQVEVEEGSFPATLSNGDAIEVEGRITPEGKLQVSKLEMEDFLELEINAFIVDIPTLDNTLTLPMAPGSPPVTVTFRLAVSSTIFPMVITPETQVEGSTPPLVLNEGEQVEFEAIFRDGEIRVIKIKDED
jgi:hypothetical protein